MMNYIMDKDATPFIFLGFILAAFLGVSSLGVAGLGAVIAVVYYIWFRERLTSKGEATMTTGKMEKKEFMSGFWRSCCLQGCFQL